MNTHIWESLPMGQAELLVPELISWPLWPWILIWVLLFSFSPPSPVLPHSSPLTLSYLEYMTHPVPSPYWLQHFDHQLVFSFQVVLKTAKSKCLEFILHWLKWSKAEFLKVLGLARGPLVAGLSQKTPGCLGVSPSNTYPQGLWWASLSNSSDPCWHGKSWS